MFDQLLAPVYEFIGSMLYWFSSIFDGHYVFGLLIYALLFKLLFLPFSIKQQKNQIKMATLTPKIELIKAKYKGRTDQVTMQKQQEEILELQQKEGYNPLSGCLPLLLQMPIIMFLYRIITSPLSYICRLSVDEIASIKDVIADHGTTYGIAEEVVNNLSKVTHQIELSGVISKYIGNGGIGLEEFADELARMPKLEILGGDLSMLPWTSLTGGLDKLSWIIIIPVVAAAVQWFAMWLTRKWNSSPATQPQQNNPQANMSTKMMDLMMPAMTIFMAYPLPALMGVYWIYQSALGILQTFILSKAMPLPKYTEEDIKEMQKAQKEAEKNARNAAKNAPKVRSLHYIDDEDYDTLPEIEGNDKNDKKNSGSMDLPEI